MLKIAVQLGGLEAAPPPPPRERFVKFEVLERNLDHLRFRFNPIILYNIIKT